MVERTESELANQIIIRPASRADLPDIEEILRSTIQNPYGSGNIDQNEVQMELDSINSAFDSSKKGQLLLAESQGNGTLGFAFFGDPDPKMLEFTHSDPKTTLELRLLYLNPTKRKQGVGSQLLDAVEQAARRMGKSKIEGTSGPRYILIGSGKFYVKRGYIILGTIPNYFEGRYWAKVFQKNIS